jgi:hypothetical protein
MAVLVPGISCCILTNNDFFYQEPNELAFNWDTCCHLVICLRLIASHLPKILVNVVLDLADNQLMFFSIEVDKKDLRRQRSYSQNLI